MSVGQESRVACRVSQYDLSAMRALDENIVSQLDLSEEATAVAMKRLSMWQEQTDSPHVFANVDTRPRSSVKSYL